jgi:acetate kinase
MTPSVFWVFNAGSSSLKFSIFSGEDPPGFPEPLYRGAVNGIGGGSSFKVLSGRDEVVDSREWAEGKGISDHEKALNLIREWIAASPGAGPPDSIGHRVVHGGRIYSAPVWIDAAVLDRLEQLVPLAPLHQPHNLRVIKNLAGFFPEVPQLACFDTAFHRTQPPAAEAFALPREITRGEIVRYGFHGISYEYIAAVLPHYIEEVQKRRRVVAAHLGNGASLCAIQDGRSVATTMGFTPLDGLVMGTRCGDLDPGAVLHLLTNRGMKPDEVADLLYHRSGLLGVSGISRNMRELLESPAPKAAEAVDLFVYRAIREIGSMAAAMGGIDTLVFTAGIGERSPAIRERIVRGCEWLGARLDPDANQNGGPRITLEEGRLSAWVIPTDEEWMIARHMKARWKERPS